MKKNNLVTMGVSFLLCVGMVGAGFASWVISADVNEDLNSTVKVEEVIDQRLVLTTSTKNAEGSGELWDADLYFGAPKDNATAPDGYTSNQYSWLSNNGTEKEDLDVYVEVVLNYDNLKELNTKSAMDTVTLTFSLDTGNVLGVVGGTGNTFKQTLVNNPTEVTMADKDETGNTSFVGTDVAPYKFVNKSDGAVTINGVVVSINIPTLLSSVDTATSNNSAGATLRYMFKFTYTWGDLFNKVNPFYFFNNKANSEKMGTYNETDYTYADVALESLQDLAQVNTDNATGNYKIALTASVTKTAQA